MPASSTGVIEMNGITSGLRTASDLRCTNNFECIVPRAMKMSRPAFVLAGGVDEFETSFFARIQLRRHSVVAGMSRASHAL
jgi:hypothetical protein